ncbi:MerR family transcriptional regulator [Ferruginivarius sediminum]|uniref:MerR family transcriptional regulator n=1 Tax=Ferruginivarius sediminum TaxID=2661937 RepID=A0A369T7C9_9PROT|nr:helix-turn-helix domain-containing protein [Ferruginivarius sediminum]RDD60782.1 MerR family transcriptional regulator [Ferruginivarius sediminum]
MVEEDPGVSIGTLARQSGCKIETIRYYERIGLICSPPRTAGGHRVFATADRKRLTFIRRARALGFTLGGVKELLRLVDSGAYGCAEIHDLAAGHLKEVRGKIAELQRLEATLSDMTSHCERGERPDCPIIDALSDSLVGKPRA